MIDSHALQTLFTAARTQNGWLDQPVSDAQLREVFDLMKMAPTSMNTQPARFVFLRTAAAKERLRPALSRGNVDKTMSAPVVTLIAHDLQFQEHLPRVFPHEPNARNMFEGDANRDFRSEPPNPREAVSIFNLSTIPPDTMRPKFEIENSYEK